MISIKLKSSINSDISIKKILINCLCGMKRKAHGAEEPRHIQKYVEVTSTAQRSDSPAQAINQRFLRYIRDGFPVRFITVKNIDVLRIFAVMLTFFHATVNEKSWYK